MGEQKAILKTDKLLPKSEILNLLKEEGKVGIIAGNTSFPVQFAKEAKVHGLEVHAVCHKGETLEAIEEVLDSSIWLKVGELSKLINYFKKNSIKYLAMAGGISRVKLFGGVKPDLRGASLLLKIRSAKDDLIMRGIADELSSEGIEVIPCTTFLTENLVQEGVLTKTSPTKEEQEDIKVGIQAIAAMSSEHIGQLVVVREGVIVAVEAVEGTDAAITRGGELGGKGVVVVKFSKATQDMRFDVPTVGVKTIQTMREAKARVLALEVGKCLILDKEAVVELANKHKIAIIGCRL